MPATHSFISNGQINILKRLVIRHTASRSFYPGRCNEAVQNCGSKTFNISSWLFPVLVVCCLWGQSDGMRPLRVNGPGIENTSWLDQNIFSVRSGLSIEQYSMPNISGTYKGTWIMHNSRNNSSRLPELHMTYGNILIELLSSSTEIHGVHYVQGLVVLGDGQSSNDDIERMQIRMDGVFVWPLRQLRMVLSSPLDGKASQSEEFLPSNPYHLLGIFSLQVLQESPREHFQRSGKNAPIFEMSKICKIQMAAQFSHLTNGEQARQQYELKGLVESPMIEGEGECFSAITVNATSVNVDVYYNKAVNYTLMVTFTSFIQVLFLIRQMDHSSTQSGAAKISLWMIGQQAIIDAYLCLLHLTAGILVESLFNAFATAAFFKFVIFSIFEMRYLLAIWKARRPTTSGEGWETMRRELSVLYSRFYGFLLGGILIMYELHNLLHYILFLLYSFWIPQIVSNVRRDSRKPVHVHYIVGITATRLAIPLYAFGCPKNFFRLKTDTVWCLSLVAFLVVQAVFLLLQHYLGSRWFIPRQLLPEKYCYFRRVDRATLQVLLGDSNPAADCVICMASVDIELHSTDCMVTPCDHFFHAGCLQRWMDIKMECPTCRRPLPPI